MAMTDDRNLIVAGGSSNLTYVYQRNSSSQYELKGTLTESTDTINSIVMSPGIGNYLFTGGVDKKPRIYQADSSKDAKYSIMPELLETSGVIVAMAYLEVSKRNTYLFVAFGNTVNTYVKNEASGQF